MINPDHPRLSIRRQCELVSVSRASFYRQPSGATPETLELMRVIDAAFMEMPWYGSRQMARHLRRQGWCVGRKRVRRLMSKIGLSPIYQAPKTSTPHPQHRIYPYLLRDLAIKRPNQVWAPTSPTSRWAAASSISSPSSTGSVARCWPGGCRSRWRRTSASRRWRRRWLVTASRRSSTPTRAAVHQLRLHDGAQGCRIGISMDGTGAGGTTSSSSGCGAASNTRTSSCRLRDGQRGARGIGSWIDFYNPVS